MAKDKKLIDTKIRAIKSTGKAGGDWLSDGEGLYLVVFPTGAKVWKLRYMTPFTKKKNTYTIGGYTVKIPSYIDPKRTRCYLLFPIVESDVA